MYLHYASLERLQDRNFRFCFHLMALRLHAVCLTYPPQTTRWGFSINFCGLYNFGVTPFFQTKLLCSGSINWCLSTLAFQPGISSLLSFHTLNASPNSNIVAQTAVLYATHFHNPVSSQHHPEAHLKTSYHYLKLCCDGNSHPHAPMPFWTTVQKALSSPSTQFFTIDQKGAHLQKYGSLPFAISTPRE